MNDFLASLSHGELMRLREQNPDLQDLLAPYEHRAFAREYVGQNPIECTGYGWGDSRVSTLQNDGKIRSQIEAFDGTDASRFPRNRRGSDERPCLQMMDLALIDSREKVERLQAELSKLPQYEPETKHYFHGGMYCREVYRDAGVLVVGKVHKQEHFYLIVKGLVKITSDSGVIEAGPGTLMLSKPGTKRAVFALEPTVCMTFHRTDAITVEEAEAELVESDDKSMFQIGNKIRELLA